MNALHQAYISALLFSSFDSSVCKEFSEEERKWAILKPIVETSWSPFIQTFEGHSNSVYSGTFSHDGQQIVSGSVDMDMYIS